MDTNQIILAVATAVLIVFSLTVALVVPRRHPEFPARRVGAFFGVAMVLVAGMLLTVQFFGEDDAEEAAQAATPEETGAPPEAEAPLEAAPPSETGAPGEAPPPAGDPAAGKEVFLGSAGCGSCHTLADAGTSGTVGPDLDDAMPSYDLVVERVTNGAGVMPAFGQQGVLSEQQIQDVAAYVVQASGG